MKLFTTFGSWGEIAPLLEVALQLRDCGESVHFLTTENWADRVRAYGIDCTELPAPAPHDDSIDGFLRAQALGKAKIAFDACAALKPSSLVASLYSFGALAYACKTGVKTLVTTTSPTYFMQGESAPVFDECMVEFTAIAKPIPLQIVGLYPWYLHENVGIPCFGFPELRALKPLSNEVQDFIQSPYGVVSRGTLVGRGNLDKMVNAIKAHGLKCLYLGPHNCRADLSVYFDNHQAAVKNAVVSITHAGIGTTIDCMGSAMVVDPVGYDQFYNADRLVNLKCAVGVQGSYITAIEDALKPRSYLPNSFRLDRFLEAMNDSPRDTTRLAADASERANLH